MRLSIHKPAPSEIQAFLDRQRGRSFSYAHVGASRGTPPAGWVVDHNRACLGHGRTAWEAARTAIRSWRMFGLDWIRIKVPPK